MSCVTHVRIIITRSNTPSPSPQFCVFFFFAVSLSLSLSVNQHALACVRSSKCAIRYLIFCVRFLGATHQSDIVVGFLARAPYFLCDRELKEKRECVTQNINLRQQPKLKQAAASVGSNGIMLPLSAICIYNVCMCSTIRHVYCGHINILSL